MEENYALDSSLEERVGKCPYSTVQSLISGKWAMLILYYLMEGPIRFNELQRLIRMILQYHLNSNFVTSTFLVISFHPAELLLATDFYQLLRLSYVKHIVLPDMQDLQQLILLQTLR